MRKRWWVGLMVLFLASVALVFKALTAPLAVNANMAEGDREVAFSTAAIILNFNQDMNVQSVRNGFVIEPPVPYTVTVKSPRAFQFRPQLRPDTAYRARLKGARKALGLGEVSYSIGFRTEPAPKVSAATWNGAALAEGQPEVPLRGELVMTFSQPMYELLTPLVLDNKTLDPQQLKWDPSGTEVVVSGLTLTHSRPHVLSVPESAVNRRLDPMMSPWKLSFTTVVQVPSAGQPERIGTSGAPVIIQIENSTQYSVRPQSGMQQADIIYEYISEYGIPRLTAIYWHPLSSLIGPVRSCRLITVQLELMYRGMIYCSGANDYVLGQVWQHPNVVFDYSYWLPYMFRTGDRVAPHNVMAQPGPVNQHTAEANLPTLRYDVAPAHDDTPLPGAEPAGSVAVGAHGAVWQYDAASKEYWKWQDGAPFSNAGTGQVHAKNVIVEYVQSYLDQNPANSFHGYYTEYYELAGEGKADIFSDGGVIHATWRHPDRNVPAVYYAPNGEPIDLNTGLTWVHVVGSNQ